MNTSFDLISIALFLGAIQGFFLSFLIHSHKESNKFSGKWLSFLLICVSSLLVFAGLYHSKKFLLVLFLGPIIFPMFLLIGPLLFFYTKSQLNKLVFNRYSFLHFIPFISFVLFLFRESFCI